MMRHATLLDVFALVVLVIALYGLRELLAMYLAHHVASVLLVSICMMLLTYIIVVDEPGVHS